jgi:hypothetical protein
VGLLQLSRGALVARWHDAIGPRDVAERLWMPSPRTLQVFGLHLCICMASHKHIHLIITCASSYVSMLQHDVSLVLTHVCIICDVPMFHLVP